MSGKITILSFIFLWTILTVQGAVSIGSTSVSNIRSGGKGIKNPFYANSFKLSFRGIGNKFVFMSKQSNGTGGISFSSQSVWQINQETATKGIDDKKKIKEVKMNSTNFLILKNGGKYRYRYPYKFIIPNESKFIRAYFLDYVQTWTIQSVSGKIITLKPDASYSKVSGLVIIPAGSIHKIEADSVTLVDFWEKDQTVALVVQRTLNNEKQAVTNQSGITMINLGTLTNATGKFVIPLP